MSERSIRRSVWRQMMPIFAAIGIMSAQDLDRNLDDNKHSRARNNYSQKSASRIKKVARWRKRNRVASASRKMNRQRCN